MAQGLAQRACTYSRTNSHAVVAVCACGWLGSVHRAHRSISRKAGGGRWVWERAEQSAGEEHREHVHRDGPLTFTLPPAQFAPLLINTKRFGHA